MNPWLYFSDSVDQKQKEVILAQLTEHGIESGSDTHAVDNGPGLYFCNELNSLKLDILGRYSDHGHCKVLVITVKRSPLVQEVWRMLGAGAADVLTWNDHTAVVIRERLRRWQVVEETIKLDVIRKNIIGSSRIWRKVLRQVIEIAFFTKANILITGESGTGKELVARLIHTLDTRPGKGNIILVDCTTIVPELSGSEFFGHKRGAFTGAAGDREGAFALADGGTLFLDEVGELPPALQAQLLRVIQEHTYKRIGGNTWRHTKFRLVCATNRNLNRAVKQGDFRSDLYHRITSWEITLPPLRERIEDIVPLARHFLTENRAGNDTIRIDNCVKEYLQHRDYPGNVRELKQLISRIRQNHVGPGPITAGDIPEDDRPVRSMVAEKWHGDGLKQAVRMAIAQGASLKEIGRTAETLAIQYALANEEGSLKRAANRLGVTCRTLQLRRAAQRAKRF